MKPHPRGRLADAKCPACGDVGRMGWRAEPDRYVCGACGRDDIDPAEMAANGAFVGGGKAEARP